MKKAQNVLFIFLFLASYLSAKSTTISVSGNVSGQWSVDTVRVAGNIEIPFGQNLTIFPGCKVFFDGYYKLTISGKLIAIGDSLNPIRFERSDTTGYSQPILALGAWEGIKMGSIPAESSILEYCIFRFMKGSRAINFESGSSNFRHCIFQDNKSSPLVYLYNSGNRITNSLFSNNSSSAVIYIEGRFKDTTFFENNTVAFNEGVGLNYSGYVKSACILTNNIFWNNGTSIPSPPEITYNSYNDYGFDTSTVIARNCIIKNGSQLSFYNASCFDQYPKFTDPAIRNFSPKWESYPVTDTGKSIAIDNGYYLSSPDSDSTRRDIGAIPFFRAERKNYTWVKFIMDTLTGYRSSLTVNFTNKSNPVSGQTNWEWTFGDGASSAAFSPNHTYTQPGIYTVKLKAVDQSGHSDSMALTNIIVVYPGTRINAGAVNGIWQKQYSPYYIHGDIVVPDNNKLVIQPGVEVRFMGSYALEVYGSLFAQGTLTDTITFKSNDTTGMRLYRGMNIDFPFADFQRNRGWVGIHFISNLQEKDTCMISYAKIRDVRIGRPNSSQYKGALKLHRIHYAEVKNSLFSNNFTTPQYFITTVDTAAYTYQTAGISSVGTNPIIENNAFEELFQFGPSAIFALYADSVKISLNRFRNITNIAVAVEKIKSFQILNNVFDSIHGKNNLFDSTHGICIRLTDADSVSTRIKNNEIKGNLFSNSRKCIAAEGVYRIEFMHNVFRGNVSDIDVCVAAWGDKIYINNNLFYNNRVTRTISNVGAVCINMFLINSKKGVIANNTIVDNYGFGSFQSNVYGDDSILVANNIVRNKSGTELQGTRFTTSWFFSNFSKAQHNNVKGGYSFGINNFDQYALFMDSLSGDFRLRRNSTSINTGRPDTAGLLLPATDLYGGIRIDTFLNRIDVGCAEYITGKPTRIMLSPDSVKENLPVRTVIAKISAVDPDPGDMHNYSFVTIPGVPNNNSNFIINNDSLYSGIVFSLSQNPQRISIRAKDNFGAYFDSSFTITINANSVTGITDINQIRDIIAVYPNPFKSNLILDPKGNRKGVWQIHTVNGQLIKSGYYQNRTSVNLSILPGGPYLLNIYDKNTLYTLKILKE